MNAFTFASLKLFLSIMCALYVVTAHAALPESQQKNALVLKNAQLDQREASYQHKTNSPPSKSINKEGLTSLSVQVGCVSGTYPTSPTPPSYSDTIKWGRSESAAITVWRQPCAHNRAKSAVFFRVVPNNAPFICSSSFSVIQNGVQYDSAKLTNRSGGSSFCDSLFVSSTFLLDQWSHKAPFDEDQAFTLIHDGPSGGNTSLNVSAYSQTAPPSGDDITMSLEVPVQGAVYSGVSSVQGWAVSPDGIDRIELFIDGQYWTNAPYGGQRTDVSGVYPDIPNAEFSGYVMAYGYTSLSVGRHTMTARAYSKAGAMKEDSSSFVVNKFHEDFFSAPDVVNASQAQCIPEQHGVFLRDLSVDGRTYNVRLEWQTATQGFEVKNIEQ